MSGATVLGGILVALIVRAIATAILRRSAAHAAKMARAQAADGDGDSATGSAGDRADREEEAAPVDLESATGLVGFGYRTVRRYLFPAIILGSVYGALAILNLTGSALQVTNGIIVVLFSLMTIRFVVMIVNEFFARTSSKTVEMSRLKPLRSLSVFAVWIVGLLFLLDNLGFNITTVVAGLGIGGIAVALSAQALLGDLFSYFVILVDKPFEIGDFLIFGDILGSVEKIGVKNTRIRSLSGEQVSVHNSDLTGSRVRNYKRMAERRIVFHIGVVYGTPSEKLERIPGMIREAIESDQLTRFDRAHFAGYGDWSLNFEIVYYVLSADYNMYMDIQQRINLEIYRAFESEDIEFAFPTHTVKLEQEGGRTQSAMQQGAGQQP